MTAATQSGVAKGAEHTDTMIASKMLGCRKICLEACILFLWWGSAASAALSGEHSRHGVPHYPVAGQGKFTTTKLPENRHFMDPAQRHGFNIDDRKHKEHIHTTASMTTVVNEIGDDELPLVPVHSDEQSNSSEATLPEPDQEPAVVAPPVINEVVTTESDTVPRTINLTTPESTQSIHSFSSSMSQTHHVISSMPTPFLSRAVPEPTYSVIVTSPTTSNHYPTPSLAIQSQSIASSSVQLSTVISSTSISTMAWDTSNSGVDRNGLSGDSIRSGTIPSAPDISSMDKEKDESTSRDHSTDKYQPTPPLSSQPEQPPVQPHGESWTKSSDGVAVATTRFISEEEDAKPSKPSDDETKLDGTTTVSEKYVSSNPLGTTISIISAEKTIDAEEVSTPGLEPTALDTSKSNREGRFRMLSPSGRYSKESPVDSTFHASTVLTTGSPARITKHWMAFTNHDDDLMTSLDEDESESLFPHITPVVTQSVPTGQVSVADDTRSDEEDILHTPHGIDDISDEIISSGEGEEPLFQKTSTRYPLHCSDGVCTTEPVKSSPLTSKGPDDGILDGDRPLTTAVMDDTTTLAPTTNTVLTTSTTQSILKETTTLEIIDTTVITKEIPVGDVTLTTSFEVLSSKTTSGDSSSEATPSKITPEALTEDYVKPVIPDEETPGKTLTPPGESSTEYQDVLKPTVEPPPPTPPPSTTKPQPLTKRPPKTPPPQPPPRTAGWQPRPITPTPMPELPPVYMTATLNMSWTSFCLRREYFKKQILRLLFTEREESRYYQVILVDIKSHCADTDTASDRNRRDVTSVRERSRGSHVSGRLRRAAEKTFVVKVDFYIADIHGKFNNEMTTRLADTLEMKLDQVHPALRLFLKFLSIKIHGHQKLVGEEEPPSPSALSTGVLAGIILGGLVSLVLVILIIIYLGIRQYKYGGVKQMRFATDPGKRPSLDPGCDAISCDAIQLTPVSQHQSNKLAFTNPTCQLADERDSSSTALSVPGLGAMLDNPDDVEQEFLSLPNPHPKLSDLPHGAEDRNRYAHVIPIPETRVRLQVSRGCGQTEYINANFVRGYQGAPRRFIATQGPLEHTRGDFWQMVWQEQVQCIIMVTGLEEQGLSKCAEYWPNTCYGDTLRVYGDFSVLLQNREEQYDCVISQLRLKHMERNLIRELHHVWLTRWPERGVPEAGAMVTRALQDVQHLIDSNLGPTVIHCSPGTGRTGTVIAIALSMRQYEDCGRVDVFKTVSQLRQDRAGLVKTKEQYAFIYQAAYEHAQSLSNPSMDSADSALECDVVTNA